MTQTEDEKAREAMAKVRESMRKLRKGVPMFEAKYAAADAGVIPVCSSCGNAHLKGIPNPDGGVFCAECLYLNADPPENLKTCPRCHGAGCILEPEESFSFSEFDPCALCKCSGKVEAKIRAANQP